MRQQIFWTLFPIQGSRLWAEVGCELKYSSSFSDFSHSLLLVLLVRDRGGHFLRWCRPYPWLFCCQNVWLGLRSSTQPSIDVTYGPGCRSGRGWVVKVVVVIFAFLGILLLSQKRSWALILSWLKNCRWGMGSRMDLPPHRVTGGPPRVSSCPKKAPNEPKMTKITTLIE